LEYDLPITKVVPKGKTKKKQIIYSLSTMTDEVDFEEEIGDPTPTLKGPEDVEMKKAPAEEVIEPPRTEKRIKVKGRGHNRREEDDDRYDGRGGVFERIEQSAGPGALQCKITSVF
jgi:hypothetical protein